MKQQIVRLGMLLVAIAAGVALANFSMWSQPHQSQIGKTCTITLQAWIQTPNTSSTGNDARAVNMLVHGVAIPPFCGGGSPEYVLVRRVIQ